MAFLFVAIPHLFFNPVKSNCAQSPARANITRINECADLPSPDKGKSGDSRKKYRDILQKVVVRLYFFTRSRLNESPFPLGELTGSLK